MATSTAATRGVLVATALTLALLLLAASLATPAQAAESEQFHFRGEIGVADWELDDARNTEVFLGAFDGQFHNPPDQPEEAEDALMFVSQHFCDENADELVHRGFFGFNDVSVTIAPGLKEGSADGTMTLHGFESRVPDCDDPNYDDDEHTDLGEIEVDLASSWEATGSMETSNSVFHFNGEEFTFHSTNVERSRDAEANATLSGLSDFGVPEDLGTTQDAELLSVNGSDVVIEH